MDDAKEKQERRKRTVISQAMTQFVQTLSEPIVQLAAAISEDLYQALAYYEVFVPSGSDAGLIRRVTELEIHPGFNVVSESLQLGCILALCRLWDKPAESTHIPGVATRLRRDRDLVDDRNALNKWLEDVQAAEAMEPLKVLREFRHVGLAHRADPNRPDPRGKRNARRVLHGDERQVLEVTVDIVDRLNALVGYPHASFRELRTEWKRNAAGFWNQVAASVDTP